MDGIIFTLLLVMISLLYSSKNIVCISSWVISIFFSSTLLDLPVIKVPELIPGNDFFLFGTEFEGFEIEPKRVRTVKKIRIASLIGHEKSEKF